MKRSLAAALVALSLSNVAHAAFYVDDDAPVQTAGDAQATSRPVSVDLTFITKHAWLTVASRSQLNAQSSAARSAEEISIVVSTAKPVYPLLARQRVDAIKQWLASAHASASIEVVEDGEPRPKELGDVVTLNMTVHNTPHALAMTQARAALATYSAPRRAPMPMAIAIAAPQPVLNDQTKLMLLQRIVMMGKNKIVKPEDAFNLVAEVLNMQDVAPTQSGLSVTPSASPIVAQLIAPEVPRQWSLDPSKSLAVNLSDWAHVAGWEVPVWNSPGQYQVGAATLNGTFYDALGQVANAVPGLDFTINKQRRTLRVDQAH